MQTNLAYPGNSALRYMRSAVYELSSPYVIFDSLDSETVVCVLSGEVEGMPERVDPRGLALYYMPPHTETRFDGSVGTELLCISAPPLKDEPRISPFWCAVGDMGAMIVGQGAYRRRVYAGFAKMDLPIRLMVGETVNEAGAWSSFPPHKHDENEGRERWYEEIYHFRIAPKSGFGMMSVYGGSAPPQAFTVRDGQTVVIPGGYHPVVAAPGCALRYIWALCGEADAPREYGAWSVDPAFDFMKEPPK